MSKQGDDTFVSTLRRTGTATNCSSSQRYCKYQIPSALATAVLLARSSFSPGLPPPNSSIIKENLVLVHPVQAAPMLRQTVRLQITDRLRATVPNAQKGMLHAPCLRQCVHALNKCYGKALNHEHPMDTSRPKCMNWATANRWAGLSAMPTPPCAPYKG